MSRGGQGPTPDRPLELIRQAVIRDGYRCSICGRPCSEKEARRHSAPNAFGDSAMNFAAMCYGCQTWLAHQGARPAQYITHIYDRSEARLQLHIIARKAAMILFISTYVAYAIFAVFVMYWTPHNVFTVLGSGLLIFYLMYLGTSFISGLLEGRSRTWQVHDLHPGRHTIGMDNQR